MERACSEVLAQEIRKSWERCAVRSLSRNLDKVVIIDKKQLDLLIDRYEFLIGLFRNIVRDVIELLEKELLFFLVDKDGFLLDYIDNIKETETGIPLCSGMSFREEDMGTNAISLAMHLGKGVAFSPVDHYCSIFHNWYCYAAPIIHNKEIIAYLDVSTIDEKMEKELIVIADLIINLINKELTHYEGINLSEKKPEISKLSDKQIEVLRLLSSGMTEEMIGQKLGISINTVKYHKKKIYAVLGTNNLPSTIVKAIKVGLINTA
ncbi:MAG: LuxR C-terminal-related transcriptional regulator [Halanaerobiales bacterium]